jgi:hypothetical protein
MVMRKHQRYFPVYSGAHVSGASADLLPAFVTVANGAVDVPTVRVGFKPAKPCLLFCFPASPRGKQREPCVGNRQTCGREVCLFPATQGRRSLVCVFLALPASVHDFPNRPLLAHGVRWAPSACGCGRRRPATRRCCARGLRTRSFSTTKMSSRRWRTSCRGWPGPSSTATWAACWTRRGAPRRLSRRWPACWACQEASSWWHSR